MTCFSIELSPVTFQRMSRADGAVQREQKAHAEFRFGQSDVQFTAILHIANRLDKGHWLT